MEPFPDFKELLSRFNARGVEYVVVGGYAVAFHGAPRYTGDIDIYVKPDPENARRVLATLSDFGFGLLGITAEDLDRPERIVQLGAPPVRVDIVTSLTGVTWQEVQAGKIAGLYGDIPVSYIGRQALVANRRATGRRKDLADLEALGE